MKPLSKAEFNRLVHWQKRMGIGFGIGLILLAGIGVIAFLVKTPPWFTPMFAILGAGITVRLLFLQMSERCPRCEARLGLQMGLSLLPNCKKCGAGLMPSNKKHR